MRFPIGTRFIRVGRNRQVETVVDYHVTKNLAGEVVQARYVTSHVSALGQIVIDNDVAETTIARGVNWPASDNGN